MAMTWTSLVAPKGTAGSIMNWVNYSKLDQETCVDEAQSLIFESLRVREMRTEWTFGMAVGQANVALPVRFLDPIGRLFDITNSTDYGHKIETDIAKARNYTPLSGSVTASATAVGSSEVTLQVGANHGGFTQGSTIDFAAPFDTLAGITLFGSYPVIALLPGAIDITIDAEVEATASTSNVSSPPSPYTANVLISGPPSRWSIWDEQVKFDTAFDTQATLKLLHYRAPKPLSAANTSNWLTDRYPMLMRKACMAAAADFMKDDTEYQKQVSALNNLIQSTAAGNDLIYRGAEFGTDTP